MFFLVPVLHGFYCTFKWFMKKGSYNYMYIKAYHQFYIELWHLISGDRMLSIGHLSQLMRVEYLSHRLLARAQMSLCMHTVSPESIEKDKTSD